MSVADISWLITNFGVDYTPTVSDQAAATPKRPATAARALQREIIDFDSESSDATSFADVMPAVGVTLNHFVPIDWPAGFAPTTGPEPVGESLPKADVLVVTWTVDEAHALSKVLTPGLDSQTGWKPYVKNYAAISAEMRAGCPAKELKRLGLYWTTTIGSKTVTVVKSDSHMSQDGPKLPNEKVWAQMIADCEPTWVISTGTGGGIGTESQVGDVLVSPWVTFDCKRQFKGLNGETFNSARSAPEHRFGDAASLFGANAGFLPTTNQRPPRIVSATDADTGVLTTDFFGFDDSTNYYGLQGRGGLSEMGDAVLGKVCAGLGDAAPHYSFVRNVSDPQIAAGQQSISQQAAMAADIYKTYGRWSTVCSAITCWAIIAGLED